MQKEEFYYDSRDGKNRIHAVRYSPKKGEEVRCVLQIVHGMAEYVERYEEFAQFLTRRGFLVTGEDHLGHGKTVGEGGKYGYFCQQDPATVVVRDVHRLKKMTQALYPDVPYVIMGHSMGSFITRNYIFRYGRGISAAVIMGTGMQPRLMVRMAKALVFLQKIFCGGAHTGRLINKMAFGGYDKEIKEARTGMDWLSRDEERVERYMADPMCGFVFTLNGFSTLFELISRLYRPENLSQIPKELPLFLVSGTADPVGDYGKGVERACASLRDAGLSDISLKMYEDARHELLNETNRSQVMQDIYDWIVQKVLG